jgi:transposase
MFWKRKYRIIMQEGYYVVQKKRLWLPFWITLNYANLYCSIYNAMECIKKDIKKHESNRRKVYFECEC